MTPSSHAPRLSRSRLTLLLALSALSVISGAVPVATAVAAAEAPLAPALAPVYAPVMGRGQSGSVYLAPPTVAPAPSSAPFAPTHFTPSPAVPAGETAYSSWTTDSDGHVTRKVFLAPAFRNRGGTWVPIDTTVAPLTDPSFPLSAESALRPVRFGRQASRLLQIELDGGPVTVSASGLSIGRPQAVDHGAKYTDVAADTDLEYQVGPQGITEKVTLRSARAPHSFTFHIADPKGQLGAAHVQNDGSVRFDGVIDQDAALALTAPFAYEQGTADASTPQAIDPSSAHMTVTRARDGYDVTESVDATWLKGKAFPLVIDPNFVTYNYSNSNNAVVLEGTAGQVASGCGGCNPVNSTTLTAGTFTGGGTDFEPARAYYHYNLGIPPNSQVSGATFYQDTTGCLGTDPSHYYCNQHSYTVQLYGMSGPWDATTPYASLGGPLTNFNNLLAQTTVGPFLITQPGCNGCFWMQWSGAGLTNLVQSWINTPSTNYGFTAKLSSEPYNIGGPYWAYIHDDGTAFAGGRPYMAVTFAPVPWAPNGVTATAGNASATVAWSPGSTVPDPVTSFTVVTYNASGQVVGQQTACATCTSALVSGLTNGQTYSFGVYASNVDGNSTTSTSSQITLPPPPTVTKTVDGSPPNLLPGQLATFHVTVSNPQGQSMPISSFTDTLPGGFAFPTYLPGSMTVDTPSASGQPCSSCSISGNTLTYPGLTLAASGFLRINYTAVVVDGGRGCSQQVNTARATSAYGNPVGTAGVTTCESGLGLERYWSYVSRSLGAGATAQVNVSDGNLVVQQGDSTPIQGHGRIGLDLRRTYNSQDTAVAGLPGSFGAGWQINVSEADASVGADATGAGGLYIPGSPTATNPLAVTLIDRDGTRHVFQPNGLSSAIDVATLSTPLFGSPTVASDVSGTARGLLYPSVLSAALTSQSTYTRVCVDETFTAPAGVHLGLWRYLAMSPALLGGVCSPASSPAPVVLGYAAVTPDRVRYEFSADGHLLAMTDGSGNQLQDVYANQPAPGVVSLGLLTKIVEPSTGRAFTFTPVPNSSTPSGFNVVDPAGRTTAYKFDGALVGGVAPHLTEVDNPDGSVLRYAYGSLCDSGSYHSGAAANQMCSETDPRGDASYFTYTSTSSDGSNPVSYPTLPRLQTISDRREAGLLPTGGGDTRKDTTRLSYYENTSPPYVTADQAGHRTRFVGIDSRGRVGEIDEGTTQDVYSRVTHDTWDGSVDFQTQQTTTCRQPDQAVDDDLCHVVRSGLGSAPDENTSYVYGDEGQLLAEHQCVGAAASGASALPPCSSPLDSTSGYQEQYAEAAAVTPTTFTDTVNGYDSSKGYGTVTSTTRSGGRADAGTLFAIVDRTQSLTPRGNAQGSSYASYVTTYFPDDSTGASPSVPPTGTVCGSPKSPTTNTGLVCEIDAPAFDSTGHLAVTTYTFDTHGQRLTMTTPKANAEGGAAYRYSYYPDCPSGGCSSGDTQGLDLSGHTPQGGWLKGITDPLGGVVAFGYDAAGDVVRSWDRNQTGGTLAAFPGTQAAPANAAYVETLYGTGASAYSAPWRYLRSHRDPLGNLISYTVDVDGNVTTTRPARGNAVSPAVSTYDVTQTFDSNDNLTSRLMPVEAALSTPAPTTFGYDAFNNRIWSIDPRGDVTVDQFDAVNRGVAELTTRGPVGTYPTPAACRTSAPADSPIAAGMIVCTTTTGYDGVDNVTSRSDGNGQTTTIAYDGVHRETSRLVPRDTTVSPAVLERTDTLYDQDGHVTDVCPPREFTEGAGACSATAAYSEHRRYDLSGRVTADTTYRTAGGAANTATSSYDADGNRLTSSDANGNTRTDVFDLLDRRVSETTPRSTTQSFTTFWTYDPVGNVTSMTQPGGLATGTGNGGALVIDGAQCPSTSPCTTTGTNFTSITLQNSGWLTVAAYNGTGGGALQLSATGTVSVCATCGVTVKGLGPAGGVGTSSGSGPAGAGLGGGRGGASSLTDGGGGGGGGHAVAGSPGTVGSPGAAGTAYGVDDLSDAQAAVNEMGSGGGAGGAGTLNSSSKSSGGAGGGLVHLSAEEIDLSGQIVADGGPGTAGSGDFLSDGAGGGGGGSGGSVWLSAPKLVLSSGSAISVAGGPSGAGAAGNNNGGAGAAGRIRIDADTLQGAQPSTPGSYRREAAGRLTLHTHDADNRPLDTVVGADSYDPAHTGTATGGANVRTRVQYDADGHVVARYEPRAFSASITNADPLFMTRTSYDADGRAVTRYVPRYDNGTQAADDLGAYSDPQSNGAQGAQCATGTTGYPASVGVCITRVTYDPAGNVSRAYLPTSNGADNRHLDYSYTADNLLASVSAPAPPGVAGPRVTAMTSAYDGDGKVISATDANGVQQLTTYYSDERVRTQTGTPNGGLTHVTQHGYDANGNSTSVTDAVGATSTTRYSADNLVTDSIDGAGDDTRYAYDPGGRTTQVYSPSAIAGDPGNPFVGSTGKGQPTVYTYTSDSLPLSVTTPVTVTTSGPTLQRQVTYGYDRGGRKTAQDTELTPPGTPSAQGTQSFSYYNDDRLATHGAENGAGTITTVYDPAGNPTSVVDTTSGSTVTATYYLDGRWRTVDDGSRQQRYAGDGAGRIVARADVVDGSGTTSLTSFTYGDAELPATMVAAAEANGTTSWGYDAGGRVTSESDPNGQSVALSYGPDGTLGSKLVSVGGSPTASWCYGAYDGDYRQKQQTFAAGACSGGVTDSYSYDGAGRVSSFQISGTATNPSIQWDHDGNRLSYTNGAATLTATYRADDSIAGGDTYDQFGRLTGDGCTTYGYDGFNRLTSATVASGGCNGRQAGTAHYTYDGLDRQVSHQDAGSSSTTAVHYDGLSSVGVIETPAGGADTLYALDPSGVHKALRSGSTPTYQYLTDDGYGNIGAVESSTGVTACADRFDPFATPQAAGSTPICAPANTADDYLYRGARQDQTTKDYQFGARTYDPAKAAFAMPDSYATAQPAADLSVGTDPLTANRYGYVNGDPVNLTDPTGHLAMHADAGCGGEDALALNDCQWQNPCRMGGHDCVDPDHIRYRDFLGTIKDAVTGCVTSFSGAATCAGVLAAPVAPEASAVLFAAAGVPSDINCVQTHDVGSCVSGGLSLLPGIAELSGPARGAVRGVLGSGEADALMQDAGKASGGVTTSPATGPPGSAVAPVALDAAAGGRAMLGKAVSPEARSLYTSPGYDPEAYLNSVANEAGINLRGVRITYDPTLPVGQPGLTLPQEAGWVIRIGPDALQPDAYAANTIAHELSHARYLQKYGSFEGEVHGHAFSFADGTPYGSGNALQAWWEGRL